MQRMLIGVCILAVLGGGYVLFAQRQPVAADVSTNAADVVLAGEAEPVYANARIVPFRYAELSFATGGTVAEIAAAEGQTVAAGAVLAQLDTTAQRARVAARQASLEQAQASYDQLRAGATPEELRAAEAAFQQAQAQLKQTVSNVSPADLRAASAQIEQAQAQLARLSAGPDTAELRSAEAALRQAQAQLDSQRDSLSATKTNAQLALDQAALSLQQAQTSYSTAKWNWEQAEATGNDPVTPSVTDATGKSHNNTLTGGQKQVYYDTFVQAQLALHSAEQAVEQAQLTYESARQAEINGIRTAEQAVDQSQAQLDRVRGAIKPDQVAGAQAQLASAQAQQTRLRGEQRSSALEAAQAGVSLAQAKLDQLHAGPRQSDLAVAQARVSSAQAELELEQVLLDQHTLRAPFAGTVAALGLRAGDYVVPGAVLVRLADITTWQVETEDLTEMQVASLSPGAPVTVTLDALPDLTLAGTIAQIRPFGEQRQGDVVYAATITLGQQDPRLRWNMSARVEVNKE
ncbi:MAG TPA: HlyD family efflux transporter periplasmic adaptor subunit [Roseiflexaceae bacterium]|nr:HlyD family efflux transporter periplasmic adaptor subunit [Roseiflexaceae bacterium]